MPLTLVTIPCLEDNYAFLVHNAATEETALVDVPDAAPIQAELDARGWQLTDILLTHHHWDHVDGLEHLTHSARVIGAAADAHRLPSLDLAVAGGDVVTVCGTRTRILDVSGHTVGHIAFIMEDDPTLAFTGDSLMTMGCGRLSEGTPAQMWSSLLKLRALPPETLVCSGHEYALGNMAFAMSLEPDHPRLIFRDKTLQSRRAAGQSTVPSTLSDEIATNPFLRGDDPVLANALKMSGAAAVDVFTAARAAKDAF